MALPDNDGFVGKYLVNTALDQASLWAKYTWYDGPVAGLGIGGGVRYVGESFGDAANTILIPDYTLFDATISFDFKYLRPDLKGWSAQINATNLANRYYVASCVTSFSYCGLGAARTVLGTIPLLTALLSAIGLVSALVGDGIWDSVSWVMLLFPILLCGYCLRQAQK